MSSQSPSACIVQGSILPKLSIVCVINNQAQDLMKWMRQAMESASQDWELVIADVQSMDGGHELAQAMEKMEPRIRLLPQSKEHWLTVLRQATDRTLGDFVVVQLPGSDLPDLELLTSSSFDDQADVVDISLAGGGAWPACRRGYWIQSAIDAAAHQPSDQIIEMLIQEGARTSICYQAT